MPQIVNSFGKMAVYNVACVFAYFSGGHKNHFCYYNRSSHRRCFVKEDVLKSFANVTPVLESLFHNDTKETSNFIKTDSNTGVSL